VSASSLTIPCLDQLADLALWEAELVADPVVVESALMARLRSVPDRRAQRGLRHPLLVILVLAACATLVVGGDSVAAIWQWAARSPQDKLARIGARCDPLTGRFEVPSERTFRRVLADLDTDALDGATCGYAADVVRGTAPLPEVPRTPSPVEREERRAVQRAAEHPAPPGLLPAAAADGKALRGARTEQGRVFLVGAIGHESGVVLGQRQVAEKRGAGSAARDLPASLDVSGMVLTLDALHTTKKTARLITDELHAHYVLITKGNQPLARAAAQALLTGPDADWVETTHVDEDRGHGRTERRTIRTAPADDTLFPARPRSSARAATAETSTAPGPPKRSSSASPACPPSSPAPPTSTTTSAGTGRWKTGSTGSETSPSTRTTPRSEPVARPESWPVSATWASVRSAWQDEPTSPTPAAISSTTTTPSPSTASDQPLRSRTQWNNAGAVQEAGDALPARRLGEESNA
jgi:hypothetical protein